MKVYQVQVEIKEENNNFAIVSSHKPQFVSVSQKAFTTKELATAHFDKIQGAYDILKSAISYSFPEIRCSLIEVEVAE